MSHPTPVLPPVRTEAPADQVADELISKKLTPLAKEDAS